MQTFVFSRRQYAPDWVPGDQLWVVPPSLDPFSTKNAALDVEEVRATLREAGLVAFPSDGAPPEFTRRGGGAGRVRHRSSLMVDGVPVPHDARVVLQVSRWDRLKDMEGVLRGFVDHLDRLPEDAHLVLAGPDVSGVTDDPEGAAVLRSCRALRASLPRPGRARVHLTALPMDDVDENAHLVNALQRHAAVVVQKSLVEGFGLTVTEPMWKAPARWSPPRSAGSATRSSTASAGCSSTTRATSTPWRPRSTCCCGDPAYADRLGPGGPPARSSTASSATGT